MNVRFEQATELNGYVIQDEASKYNAFVVYIDDKLWGWATGPYKGQKMDRATSWMALKADGGVCWNNGHPNREAAVLAAM